MLILTSDKSALSAPSHVLGAHVPMTSGNTSHQQLNGRLQQPVARAGNCYGLRMPADKDEPLPVFHLQPYLNGRAVCTEPSCAQMTLRSQSFVKTCHGHTIAHDRRSRGWQGKAGAGHRRVPAHNGRMCGAGPPRAAQVRRAMLGRTSCRASMLWAAYQTHSRAPTAEAYLLCNDAMP